MPKTIPTRIVQGARERGGNTTGRRTGDETHRRRGCIAKGVASFFFSFCFSIPHRNYTNLETLDDNGRVCKGPARRYVCWNTLTLGPKREVYHDMY